MKKGVPLDATLSELGIELGSVARINGAWSAIAATRDGRVYSASGHSSFTRALRALVNAIRATGSP